MRSKCIGGKSVSDNPEDVLPPREEAVANGLKIITFGCRLNTYESEVMKTHAKNAGLENAVIINTCAVTGEAERQARQAVRKARRENPDAKIIVTGCAAQVHTESFASMDEVDQVIGNDIKLKPEAWNPALTERVRVNDIMQVRDTAGHMIAGFDHHARAFVQVQNGCDHRCTFCIIPYGRGNSRSVAMGEIVEQVRKLVAGGYNEIVLTGVDITSYGADLPGQPSLGQMVRRLLGLVPEIKRLRLSSLDPVEIDDDLWRLIAEDARMMPHLHLSMQAGDDMVLKRMKRRHLRKDLYEVCEKARSLRPDIVFGADIIAGFPTETGEMFQNTYNALKDCGVTFLHVFPYSARIGTPAARMPQVAGDVRKERARLLRELGVEHVKNHLSGLVGKTLPVLVERNKVSRTEYFSEVRLDKQMPLGQIVMAELDDIEGEVIKGRVAA
ncbi:MAG: tRNA (N(6)-L-threonylcarbamoyladenosine(37)-C(2))-methylthiotransferase MtaB [Alphaproteobacteria bacterium]|nr:tRNA (N(6)-L-threonylcarbamoyladenosine(37)-C(2))-methylthiotransferase MtaB [Alphaproteobacteria bacterium]MDE2336610.1 tRNA (N(6)-L-threonylcarbamoyladenosine(37)-C(2))-methylthiotransferase MtaB [Alphaproteobacteria bacterium]